MDEGRELEEEHSAPPVDISALSAAGKRQKTVSTKVRENAEGSAASKVSPMRDSDALLTLVGEIVHGDPDCWGILLTKQQVQFNADLPNTLPSTTIRSR